jgi:ribonuclease E
MSKRILINATPAGEVWATFVENGTLEELFVESSRKQVMRGNLYRAHVTSIDNKLRAAFIDYGTERNGFISIKEIHPSAYHRVPRNAQDFQVSEVLQVGQPLLVQLKKEEEGGKGAAFTTDVTLASSYTVISPVSGGEFTMSRKITDAKVKRSFKAMMKQCDAEGQYGVMLRTASEGRESHEVLADLQTQLRAWGFIQADFQSKRTPCLLYKESQLITRMVRDHFTDDVDEVILDDEEAFEDLKRYCEERLPNAIPKLRLCEERLPLFVRYKVEGQINQLTTHILELPSGGNISVNHTEAATVFDINSSRQSGGGDQQQMFLITNCEAAELIARQVRLRGIGGLIFIDFINMREQRHRRQVEKVFKEAIKRDRAHLEVGVISRFCVLELSRNRIQERSLSTTHTSCPTCSGSGYIPSPNVVAFKLINSLYALAERIGPGRVIKGKLPVAHAMYLLNDKRAVLVDLEERYGVNIEIEADFTQSLLAPDPFTEAGRTQKPSSSSDKPSREQRRERRGRRGRDQKSQSPTAQSPKAQSPKAQSPKAQNSKAKALKTPKAQTSQNKTIRQSQRSVDEPRQKSSRRQQPVSATASTETSIVALSADQAVETPVSTEGAEFTPPQIVGFISKDQLDRAEAASLLSQSTSGRSGFEGRPARGEASDQEASDQEVSPSEVTEKDSAQVVAQEEGGRKRRRRRRGRSKNREHRDTRTADTQSEPRGSEESSKGQAPDLSQDASQITAGAQTDKPEIDERARRRAEARERNRARSNRKSRGHNDSNSASPSRPSSKPERTQPVESHEQEETQHPNQSKREGTQDSRRRRRGRSDRSSQQQRQARQNQAQRDDVMSESSTESTTSGRESSAKLTKSRAHRADRLENAESQAPTSSARLTAEETTSKTSTAKKKRAVKKKTTAAEASATEISTAEKTTAEKTTSKKAAPKKKATAKKTAPKKKATAKKVAPKKEATAKKATAKKTTAKKVTAKKTTAKEATAKEATAKKATAKKATAEKTTAKKATAKKATAKKATAKKATAKEATAKEATAKKATAKKATAKKATAKKATAKKATAKKATTKKATAKKKTTKKASQSVKDKAAALLDRLDQ